MFNPNYTITNKNFKGFHFKLLEDVKAHNPALEKIGLVLMCLLTFFLSVVFIEPSPHDVLAPLAIIVWLALGLVLSRAMFLLIIGLMLYNVGGFISLIPHMTDSFSVIFMFQSLYLAVMAVFYCLFFYENTTFRLEIILRSYAAGCVLASLAGIVGYFNILNLAELFTRFGRASGTFKDPNVFGSFLILGALYLLFNLLLGRTRWIITYSTGLIIVLVGVLLSFSRGSWAGAGFAIILMFGLTFITTRSLQTRKRIITIGFLGALSAVLSFAALVSIPEVAQMLEIRASVTQDYDEGQTGRFGNQLRSIPMLLEEPNGFGPLQFRNIFGLEPHNTYVNAFASYGWLGGFAFFMMVISTTFIGFRLCLRTSPIQPYAIMIWPALFVFFLQALQIDIDHWRHFYLMLGMVWGMEAARHKWVRSQS